MHLDATFVFFSFTKRFTRQIEPITENNSELFLTSDPARCTNDVQQSSDRNWKIEYQ